VSSYIPLTTLVPQKGPPQRANHFRLNSADRIPSGIAPTREEVSEIEECCIVCCVPAASQVSELMLWVMKESNFIAYSDAGAIYGGSRVHRNKQSLRLSKRSGGGGLLLHETRYSPFPV